MHSISDLTTYCRKTTGDVPPKLVGASTTVVGSNMYLFGGRLVTERKMVADLFVFDLESFKWEKIQPHLEDEAPRPRYFHSADTWNNQLIIFGGMGNKIESLNPEDLCVLNDVRFFDLATRRWTPSTASNGVLSDPVSDSLVPKARYAHLSSVTADRLFIIGGQDLSNVWLDDVYVYDLLGKAWVQRRDYPRHCGTYRSVAVAADMCVRLPQDEPRTRQAISKLGPPGTRFLTDKASPSSTHQVASESLVHLPYSTQPSEEYPSDIYLYSNYNFTDVKRELEVFSPLPDTDFTIHDRSSAMCGNSFPPGLRFPTGAILGTHFIIAGTYLAHTYQSFSIWALDLLSMTWSRIDPGSAVSTGSWFRGCLWADSNKFLIFGNRTGNLVDDYNRRLLSWDHVAVIDLEAFGIYQPPPIQLDIAMQELGLSALEEDVLSDFEVVCDDGRKVRCSRKLLENRWPWFEEQRSLFIQNAKRALETLPTSPMHVPLPNLPGTASSQETRLDPRLTPRSFHLSEPYPITLALLQYLYSMALITPLQHAPAVLSQLLVLSSTYQIKHLESLVKHAMHRALSNSTSVGVYEVATLCSCRSLQIRALKTVMSYSQRRPSGRSRQDSRGGGSRDPGGGGAKSTTGWSGEGSSTARPRGTSDAHPRGPVDQQNSFSGSSKGYMAQGEIVASSSATMEGSASRDHVRPDLISMSSSSRRQERTLSVVSATTDQEILSMAELLSPSLIHERNDIAEIHTEKSDLVDDINGIIEPSNPFESDLRNRMLRSDSYLRPVSPHLLGVISPQRTSSPNSDSETDDPWDRGRLATLHYPAFHNPNRLRHQRSFASDSDTPSLTTSTSYGSLTSPGRSNFFPNTPESLPSVPATLEDAVGMPRIIESKNHGSGHRSLDGATTIMSAETSMPHSVSELPPHVPPTEWPDDRQRQHSVPSKPDTVAPSVDISLGRTSIPGSSMAVSPPRLSTEKHSPANTSLTDSLSKSAQYVSNAKEEKLWMVQREDLMTDEKAREKSRKAEKKKKKALARERLETLAATIKRREEHRSATRGQTMTIKWPEEKRHHLAENRALFDGIVI